MPKPKRPNDIKLLKPWAMKVWPNDPVSQTREITKGTKAINDANASMQKNQQEMQRRQNNLRNSRGK